MDIKNQILNRTRQGLDVFHHYLGVKFYPNRKFKNPLYNDTKASCYIYLGKKSGIYKMKDFGDINYSGDCFWLVAMILGLDMKNDFKQILPRINEDMHLCISMDSIPDDSKGNSQKYSATTKPEVLNSSVTDSHEEPKADEKPPQQPKIKLVYKEFSEEEL